MTSERQAILEESRERRVEPGSQPRDGTSGEVPKDGDKVRSLTESMSKLVRKLVLKL